MNNSVDLQSTVLLVAFSVGQFSALVAVILSVRVTLFTTATPAREPDGTVMQPSGLLDCSFHGTHSYALLLQLAATSRLLCFRDEPTLRRFCTHCGLMFQVAIYFSPGHPCKKCLLSQETRRVILNRTEPLFFGFSLIPMSFGFGKQYGQTRNP